MRLTDCFVRVEDLLMSVDPVETTGRLTLLRLPGGHGHHPMGGPEDRGLVLDGERARNRGAGCVLLLAGERPVPEAPLVCREDTWLRPGRWVQLYPEGDSHTSAGFAPAVDGYLTVDAEGELSELVISDVAPSLGPRLFDSLRAPSPTEGSPWDRPYPGVPGLDRLVADLRWTASRGAELTSVRGRTRRRHGHQLHALVHRDGAILVLRIRRVDPPAERERLARRHRQNRRRTPEPQGPQWWEAPREAGPSGSMAPRWW